MPPVDVTDKMIEYVTKIFMHREDAETFVTDARGDMAAEGLLDYDTSNVNMQYVMDQACTNAGLPREIREAVASNPAPPHPTVNEVVTHVTQATQIVYQNDEYITQIIDQSQTIQVAGDVNAPINATNDPTNVIAEEGGTAVAEEGEGDANVASGAQSQAVGGDLSGEVNNLGEGAQQVDTGGGSITAPIIGGDNSGIAAGGPVTGSVAGDNTGINAGGNVSGGIVGDHNQAAQVTGNADDAVFNFGGGPVTEVNAPVTNSAVGVEGNAQVIAGNTASQGGAIGGGPTSGHYEDNDQDNDTDNSDHSTDNSTHTWTETNASTVTADHSNVSTAQDDSDSSADHNSNHESFDAPSM